MANNCDDNCQKDNWGETASLATIAYVLWHLYGMLTLFRKITQAS